MFIVFLESLYEIVTDVERRFSFCFRENTCSLAFLVIKYDVTRNVESDVWA